MLTLVAEQLLDGFSGRSQTVPAWRLPENPIMTRSIFGLLGLQALVCAALRRVLEITPLGWLDVGVVATGSIVPFLAVVESLKAISTGVALGTAIR